jgi:hypothetical protein
LPEAANTTGGCCVTPINREARDDPLGILPAAEPDGIIAAQTAAIIPGTSLPKQVGSVVKSIRL